MGYVPKRAIVCAVLLVVGFRLANSCCEVFLVLLLFSCKYAVYVLLNMCASYYMYVCVAI